MLPYIHPHLAANSPSAKAVSEWLTEWIDVQVRGPKPNALWQRLVDGGARQWLVDTAIIRSSLPITDALTAPLMGASSASGHPAGHRASGGAQNTNRASKNEKSEADDKGTDIDAQASAIGDAFKDDKGGEEDDLDGEEPEEEVKTAPDALEE